MRPPDFIPPFLGFLLGFLTRPLIMGCIESKPEPIKQSTSPNNAQQQSQPVQPLIEQPIAANKVADVPKPKVDVTDRDRAYLKVKSLRDKAEYLALQSDAPLKEYGRRAVLAKRDGNMISARMLLVSRERLRQRVEMQMANVQRLNDMVDAMDDARQNEKLFEALESGTKAINEVLSVLTPEKVQQVLDDSHEAKGNVAELNALMGEDTVEMSEVDFETAMKELEGEFSDEVGQQTNDGKIQAGAKNRVSSEEQSPLQQVLNVSDVPTELPGEPVAEPRKQDAEESHFEATPA